MRALVVLILAVVVVMLMAWAGWVQFQNRPDGASVTVDKVEIREDLDEAKDAGERVFDRTGDAIDKSTVERDSSTRPVPSTPVR